MDRLHPLNNLPYPRFTDRARNTMVRANRLAADYNSDVINGLLITIAAIESDSDLRQELPKLSFDTVTILETLKDVLQQDCENSAKAIITGAVMIAGQTRAPIDTMHLLQSAFSNPNPATVTMLNQLDLTTDVVLQTIDKLSAS